MDWSKVFFFSRFRKLFFDRLVLYRVVGISSGSILFCLFQHRNSKQNLSSYPIVCCDSRFVSVIPGLFRISRPMRLYGRPSDVPLSPCMEQFWCSVLLVKSALPCCLSWSNSESPCLLISGFIFLLLWQPRFLLFCLCFCLNSIAH